MHHFKACNFYVLLTLMLNFNRSDSPVNEMPMIILGQGSHAHIFLSPTLPNAIVCKTSSIMPKYRHVHKYTIYKFIYLSAMNLKYVLRISCIGCVPIHYYIQHMYIVYTREVHTLYVTKSCMTVHANH